jgi:hypothetical protein
MTGHGPASALPAVAYSYAPGRSAVHLHTLLKDYRGIAQCDVYASYKQLPDDAITLAFLLGAGPAQLLRDCEGRQRLHRNAVAGVHCGAPGDFDDPHDIALGGSLGRIYVADRLNSRIQVFDQDGNFITAWHQFGQPSSVFVGPDDKIYVGVAFRDEATRRNPTSRVQPGELRGIMVGSAIDGSLLAFIPDPSDLSTVGAGTSAAAYVPFADPWSALTAPIFGACPHVQRRHHWDRRLCQWRKELA